MQLLLSHLVGDYLLQSQWMAEEKTRSSMAAGIHAAFYTIPFALPLLLYQVGIRFLDVYSTEALMVIVTTHFIIDRFALARRICWLKNYWFGFRLKWLTHRLAELHRSLPAVNLVQASYLADLSRYSWKSCSATGCPQDVPPWLAVWLLIVADNTLHLLINFLAAGLL